MNREQIRRLLIQARDLTQHQDYVIIGSLSVLGRVVHPPPDMVMSVDIDLYPLNDPGRASEIDEMFGQGSAFDNEHGYYADAVSPQLASLPEGWEQRLIPVDLDGVVAHFLEPHDAAISKYARGEERDRRWIREGLKTRVLSMPTLQYRLRETILETDERERTNRAIEEDKVWLAAGT